MNLSKIEKLLTEPVKQIDVLTLKSTEEIIHELKKRGLTVVPANMPVVIREKKCPKCNAIADKHGVDCPHRTPLF